MRRVVIGCVVWAAAMVAGCADRSERAEGEGVRIVALSPALALMLQDLGLGDRLVGRHAYDVYSDISLPAVGDQGDVDLEKLLRVRPTHLIVQRDPSTLPRTLMEACERRGIVLECVQVLSLDELNDAARRLGGMFGREDEAARLVERLEGAMSPIEGFDAGVFGRVVLLTGSAGQYAALGPGSFHAELAERLGLRVAPEGGGAYVVMDAEDVLRLAPETIVVFRPRGEGEPNRTGVVGREGWRGLLGVLSGLEIPALAAGRVVLIDDPRCLLPAMTLVEVAEAMRGALGELAGEG